MGKFKIWDKAEPILTPVPDPKTGKGEWTAQEYIKEKRPWAGHPDAVVVISGGMVNGATFNEYFSFIQSYQHMGFVPPKGATHQEVLDALETWLEEERQAQADAAKALAETEQALLNAQINACEAQERTAAMLEFQTMMQL